MVERIPAPIVDADRIHNQILKEIPFSRFLNPTNAEEARQAFGAGVYAPPFVYQHFTDADEYLHQLDKVEPPRDHPAGDLVGKCMDHTRWLIIALRDRTAEAFHNLALSDCWYPEPEFLALRFPEPKTILGPLEIEAEMLIAYLEDALHQRGIQDWRILRDSVMSARVLVDGAKRVLRVNPLARFRRTDLDRLVAHEIDVHVLRSVNGQRQELRCFETGLPGSLSTEEGLAMVAEERTGTDTPGVLARQVEVLHAIQKARKLGFRDLFEELELRVGTGLAWGICLRIKRGLNRPDLPGVYAKDSVYLRGRMRVNTWLTDGGNLRHLYVGKVGIDDPVEEWLNEGWVRGPRFVPDGWIGL